MSKDKVYIFDTTLRDGAQTQGVDFSLDDKLKIANSLDALGVDYIEGGWPGANPTDTEFFQKNTKYNNSILTAFGMTKRTGRSAENDPGLSALLNSNTKAVCLVGKSWDFHVDVALGITKEENLFLNKEPVIWLDQFQLTSDSIRILLNKDLIKMAFLNKRAFISLEVDSSCFNQISGENMKAYFYENELSNIEVIGNGESIYYVTDEKKNEAVGVNKIICSNMNINIKNRKIQNINFYNNPDAMLYPINLVNQNDLLLKGFELRNKSLADKIISDNAKIC